MFWNTWNCIYQRFIFSYSKPFINFALNFSGLNALKGHILVKGRLAKLSPIGIWTILSCEGNEQEASASMVFYILAMGISYH